MKVICFIITLFMAQSVFAADTDLSITVVDNTGFRATLINAGDLSVVIALTEVQPTVLITGPDSEIKGIMYKAGTEIYQFEFIPSVKGIYHIKVMSGGAMEVLDLDVN